MTDLIAIQKIAGWEKLKALVLDSVSSPITKRVYNMALDEFLSWFQQAPRPGFTKATVSAWRVSLEARSLGSSSIKARPMPEAYIRKIHLLFGRCCETNYTGVCEFGNEPFKIRNPETGSKARPREASQRVRFLSCASSEELWTAVQFRIAELNTKLAAARLGGMNRTPGGRSYLFSGLLVCGSCKSRLVIVSGQGKRGYVRYDCPSHRYRGVCDILVTIRQDRLEEQLLAAIEQRIANPRMIEHILIRFQDYRRALQIFSAKMSGWTACVTNGRY